MVIRAGQKAFNDLYLQHPTVAKLIQGTEFDPFYDDSKIEKFDVRVAELLKAGVKYIKCDNCTTGEHAGHQITWGDGSFENYCNACYNVYLGNS